MKITEKVSFNIASEASYVYLLNGQKFIKNAQNGHFGDFLKLEACCQTVLPDRLILKGQKLMENAKNVSLQNVNLVDLDLVFYDSTVNWEEKCGSNGF